MFFKRPLFFLLLIILLGAFLRFYRIYDLAIFLADQASDSQAVLQMLRVDFTLLGPPSSVGGFYNGPIVYYLMLPFYWIFRGEPIAGAVFQSVFSLATIPFIYLIGKKLKNETVGLLASFLFAISPLMIEYSRQGFNSLPAIFFSTLILYLYLEIVERFSTVKITIMGIAIGFIMQMHYLTVTILLFVLTYPFLFKKKLISLRYYGFLFVGVIIGLSPYLIFELKHDFLNIRLIIRYFFSAKKVGRSLVPAFSIWPEVMGKILFAGSFILGVIGSIGIIGSTVLSFKKKFASKKYLSVFVYFFIVVFAAGLLYGGTLNPHYIIVFHTSLFLLFSLAVYTFSRGNIRFILFVSLVLLLLNSLSWNLTSKIPVLQDGLKMKDFEKAATIIKKDPKKVYNVTMHAQGDNRAMPLRYYLSLLGENPMPYENYSGADDLYLIIRKDERPQDLTIWEYTSFGPSYEKQKWVVNDDYLLYKLGKK